MRKIKTKEFNVKSQSKRSNRARLRGFTLMELLVYIGVFSVASVFLTNILLTVTNISTRESATREVSSQLDTTLETIQQLIQQSSNIESATGSTLKLRMVDPTIDPTCITLDSESGVVKIAQGSNGVDLDACSTTKTDLTTNKVTTNILTFTKIDNIKYSATEEKDLAGHSVVNIDMAMTYNTTNPKYEIQRTLTSAVGRVSAATFDSDLLPDATGTRNIGTSALKWGTLNVNGAAYFGINAGSNVGIGTISPAKKLDIVNGIARENGYNLDVAGTDNLVLNGDFEMGRTDGWTSGGAPTVIAGGYSGNYALQITGSGGNTLSDDYIPVDPTRDVLQLEGYFKKTVAGVTPGKLYFGYMAYNAAKTAITTAPCGSYCYFAASAYVLPADGAWHKFSATTTGEGTAYPNFPVGTKYVRVLGLINYNSSADAVTLMDHISVRRINNGPLFVGNNFSSSNLLDQHQVSKIYTTNANYLILEPAASGNVGIGTTTPGAKLEVAGQVKITGGTPGAGKVLTSDANGLASWEVASSGSETINPIITTWSTYKHYFVTASTYNGNLGGLAGCDTKCNSDANKLTDKTYHCVRSSDSTWNVVGKVLYNTTYGSEVDKVACVGTACDTLSTVNHPQPDTRHIVYAIPSGTNIINYDYWPLATYNYKAESSDFWTTMETAHPTRKCGDYDPEYGSTFWIGGTSLWQGQIGHLLTTGLIGVWDYHGGSASSYSCGEIHNLLCVEN
jgi:type II secretory pathway pseudopilin PulG